MSTEMSKNEQEEDSERNDEIYIWLGLGAVTVAAIAGSIYMVQKNRTNELNAMRYNPVQREASVSNMFGNARENFVSFWESTTETFGKINGFVRRVLSSSQEETGPLFPGPMPPVDRSNDSEASDAEKMV
jgi:hypothetical protein